MAASSCLPCCRSERARELGALEQRPAGRDYDTKIAAADALECLNSLAGDLGVSFGFSKTFAGRVEGNVIGFGERGEIGEPALGAGHIVADDDEEPVRSILRESGEEYSIARPAKSSNATPIPRRRQATEKFLQLAKRFGDGEQLRERHGAR